MATKPHERVFSLVLAVVFFMTSVGVGLGVILLVKNEQKQEKNQSEVTKAIKDAQEAASYLTCTATEKKEGEVQDSGKLEGQKLANFTPVEKVDSLQCIDLQVGTGDVVKTGATVTAHYTGALAKDGTIFQSSHDMEGDQPIEFSLSGVIPGWTQGVPGMKVGGRRRLIIPSALAYGAAGQGNIPANSDLVFDIELSATK